MESYARTVGKLSSMEWKKGSTLKLLLVKPGSDVVPWPGLALGMMIVSDVILYL